MRTVQINGFPKYTISEDGSIHGKRGWDLKPAKSGRDKTYLMVILCNNKIRKSKLVHRILAEHFIPNPNNLPMVNHIDGNTFNNSLSNLEWVTASENTIHSFSMKNRIILKGEQVYGAKLTAGKVKEIRRLRETGLSYRAIARVYSVDRVNVSSICKRETWKHI